ncbi:hypothetical protein PPYR_02322 [Photinus pyralis]|uniref:Tc1-like transposase DDE domain-containing protein n=1 Tax=Photinus pyralis TaxID=7054 RepID=A0A5N4B6X6_PHOPY|nr:hypothetical protein PPYR_02322 [Photinus pyralis]
MQRWLDDKNVPYTKKMTKLELYEVIKRHRSQSDTKKYTVDSVLAAHGHSVLRLPPYHPELNPIERIWAYIKQWVASHNTTFKLDDIKRLAETKFAQDCASVIQSACEHSKKVESQFMESEHVLDISVNDVNDH